MPLPVTLMTTGPSSLPMCPLSIRRSAAPSVTPPGGLREDALGLGEQAHRRDDLVVVGLRGPAARADDRLARVEAVGPQPHADDDER